MPRRDEQRAFYRYTRMKLGLPIPDWLEEARDERERMERELPRGDREGKGEDKCDG